MKDTLTKILKGFRTPICEGLNAKIPYINALADYLVAEGVIVAPCKVGDTVYRVMCRGFGDYFLREETVWIVDMHATAGLEITTKHIERKGLTIFKRIDIEDIGKHHISHPRGSREST